MITESMMYWITRLDAIQAMCILFSSLGAVAMCIGWAVYLVAEYVDNDELVGLYKVNWVSTIITIVFSVGLVFTPTTKEMAMIYTVPAITRSDFVQKDLPDLYDLGIKALKEQLITDKDK